MTLLNSKQPLKYGSCPITDPNGWRIRTNDELQVMYRKRNIATTIKVRRLEWTGCLVRMSDGRTVKKVFLGKPDGRRKAGRPRLRWLDYSENDLKSMGVKRWRKKAEDRLVWAIILKEALVKLEGGGGGGGGRRRRRRRRL
jgi:hypothetical protein